MPFDVLLFALLGLLLLGVLLYRVFSLLFIGFRRRRKIKIDDFLSPTEKAALGDDWHPVRFSSAGLRNKFFRLLPWEAVGVLLVGEKEFRFYGKYLRGSFGKSGGEGLRLSFSRDDTRISYVEKSTLRDGGLSWFKFESGDKEYFFTSETALPNFSRQMSTTGIYEFVVDSYTK